LDNHRHCSRNDGFFGICLFNPTSYGDAFKHLGFPGYFRIELAIAKIIGVAVLLAPVNARLKEWVYAGFAFTFVSAIIAHTASGDPMAAKAMPAVLLVLLATSYVTYYKQQQAA
jgi:hypothetical protein